MSVGVQALLVVSVTVVGFGAWALVRRGSRGGSSVIFDQR